MATLYNTGSEIPPARKGLEGTDYIGLYPTANTRIEVIPTHYLIIRKYDSTRYSPQSLHNREHICGLQSTWTESQCNGIRGESGSTVDTHFSQSRRHASLFWNLHRTTRVVPSLASRVHVTSSLATSKHPNPPPQFLEGIRDCALLLARNADHPHTQQARVLEAPAFGSVRVAQAEEEPSDAALVLEVEALEFREQHREIKLVVITREDGWRGNERLSESMISDA
ncbi:hypothetical protein PLEOSDRAFT_1108026 [Pleurotus ostreatus PC15]|uniref:Uncharacterized protein n=1 Tax=Pleurotus ostreatus (strain PC15) TaxID=1137138 RepID=A0A067NAP5_PLEO1|nr:hypothetical protein PLEOSDRAFT_1108026 [Pleurotus ostreatus PC15]